MKNEDEKLMKEFGQMLSEKRKSFRSKKYPEKGPTLRQLGEDASVDYSLIGALENGRKRAGIDTLRKIAGALQLSGAEMREFVFEGRRTADLNEFVQDASISEGPSLEMKCLALQVLFPQIPKSIARMKWVDRLDQLEVVAKLDNGKFFGFDASVIFGDSEEDVTDRLESKREALAEEVSPVYRVSGYGITEDFPAADL